MANVIIDRRKNSSGKNTPNRQKFLRRARSQIKDSIRKKLGQRDITASNSGENVRVKRRGIQEPEFRNDPRTGDRDLVLPGNQEYSVGDHIPIPRGGSGSAAPGDPSNNGETQDDFEFAISNDEYVDMLFEDLELPHMVKRQNTTVESYERNRSGYSNEGNPSQLNLVQSMRNSIGRRMALKKPKSKRIRELEELLATLKPGTKRYKQVALELEELKRRHGRVPFLDTTDLRYNNYTVTPRPTSQAVIFMIMDVSGSMTEHHKDLAKRFFTLLNLFISRRYKRTEVVFIRHHHEAEIVNEQDFFHKRESGGTVVSTAYDLMLEHQKRYYPADKWNIYVAQATDGDNFAYDNSRLSELLTEQVLPLVQYLAYILVSQSETYEAFASAFGVPVSQMKWDDKALTKTMKKLEVQHENMIVKHVDEPAKVYPIFREIFQKA